LLREKKSAGWIKEQKLQLEICFFLP
jgi:hypothetical protein